MNQLSCELTTGCRFAQGVPGQAPWATGRPREFKALAGNRPGGGLPGVLGARLFTGLQGTGGQLRGSTAHGSRRAPWRLQGAARASMALAVRLYGRAVYIAFFDGVCWDWTPATSAKALGV